MPISQELLLSTPAVSQVTTRPMSQLPITAVSQELPQPTVPQTTPSSWVSPLISQESSSLSLNNSLVHKMHIATNPNVIPLSSNSSMSDDDNLLTLDEIIPIFYKSCSRRNFAARLVKRLILEKIRRISNLSGTKGKQQLDPSIIRYTKATTFEHWPLKHTENMDKEWEKCKAAIEQANRSTSRIQPVI